MCESSDAAFREIADWPAPGDHTDPDKLILLALTLIAENRHFIAFQVPAEEGFGPPEVISLLMYRAYRGGGLTRSLARHVDGTDPIRDVKALLLQYTEWAVGESRGQARRRREEPTDWQASSSSPSEPAAPPAWDADGCLTLIDILTRECDRALTSAPPDLRVAVRHVTERMPILLAIFGRYAPEPVYAEVASLDAQDRACVLLGLFPLRLPHRAVTTYRQMMSVGNQMTPDENGGGITVNGTQKRISRLRERLRNTWPSELMPPGIRAGKFPQPDDDDAQEVP
jgi:hypothetical protein